MSICGKLLREARGSKNRALHCHLVHRLEETLKIGGLLRCEMMRLSITMIFF